MSGYYEFSYIYDILMSHLVDYDEIAGFIAGIIRKYQLSDTVNIIETGCGSANVTVPLAKRGYEISASDISFGMIQNAQNYVNDNNLKDKINLSVEDMTKIKSDKKFDAAICMMDSLNHLESKEKVEEYFKCISQVINKDGLLIFDVNSKYKFEELLCENAYTYNLDEIYAVWQNDYDENDAVNRSEVTFFCENEDGLYERYEEDVFEYYYSPGFLKNLLVKYGFELLAVYDDFNLREPDDETQRLVFAARKK